MSPRGKDLCGAILPRVACCHKVTLEQAPAPVLVLAYEPELLMLVSNVKQLFEDACVLAVWPACGYARVQRH